MIWRGIVFFFAVFTSLVLAWVGFSHIWDGVGLNPWIAFPGAIIIHCLAYGWLANEATSADVAITDYLDWLGLQEQEYQDWYNYPDIFNVLVIEGSMIQIERSKQFWEDLANRHP